MKRARLGWMMVAAGLALAGCGGTGERAGPAPQAAAPSPTPAADGWTQLFDGTTLNGWTQRGGKAQYLVEPGGVLLGRTVPNTPNSFLCTEATYADFELELDFKIDAGGNSGVQIRSESKPEYQNGRVHGYQVEIDPSERAWTAGLYDEGRRGWLVDLKNNEPARKAYRAGEWNHLRVTAVGDTFNTWINGVPAVKEFHDDRTRMGFIALQVHGVSKAADGTTPTYEVRWRNVRLRPLAAR
jgi:hypothetical protein